MVTDLQATVEDASCVFDRYTVGDGLAGVCACELCMSEETERAPATTLLRQITSRLLGEYT